MPKRMQIVDPHHHLWDLNAVHYPWLLSKSPDAFVRSYPELAKNYLLSDYMADVRDFDLVKSVHVEALPDNPVVETAWLQAIADDPASGGFPHGIVANADLLDNQFPDMVASHSRYANLRGIRQVLSWETEPDMNANIWRENFKYLGEVGLSFDMQITPDQMQDAASLAKDFPGTLIVLNHTGLPNPNDSESCDIWRSGMTLLASCENIAVKISGFGILDPNWTTQTIRPFILKTIDFFSPSRCMFASDFPVDRLFRGFTETWTAFIEITEDFSDSEKVNMFHDNAVTFYRL